MSTFPIFDFNTIGSTYVPNFGNLDFPPQPTITAPVIAETAEYSRPVIPPLIPAEELIPDFNSGKTFLEQDNVQRLTQSLMEYMMGECEDEEDFEFIDAHSIELNQLLCDVGAAAKNGKTLELSPELRVEADTTEFNIMGTRYTRPTAPVHDTDSYAAMLIRARHAQRTRSGTALMPRTFPRIRIYGCVRVISLSAIESELISNKTGKPMQYVRATNDPFYVICPVTHGMHQGTSTAKWVELPAIGAHGVTAELLKAAERQYVPGAAASACRQIPRHVAQEMIDASAHLPVVIPMPAKTHNMEPQNVMARRLLSRFPATWAMLPIDTIPPEHSEEVSRLEQAGAFGTYAEAAPAVAEGAQATVFRTLNGEEVVRLQATLNSREVSAELLDYDLPAAPVLITGVENSLVADACADTDVRKFKMPRCLSNLTPSQFTASIEAAATSTVDAIDTTETLLFSALPDRPGVSCGRRAVAPAAAAAPAAPSAVASRLAAAAAGACTWTDLFTLLMECAELHTIADETVNDAIELVTSKGEVSVEEAETQTIEKVDQLLAMLNDSTYIFTTKDRYVAVCATAALLRYQANNLAAIITKHYLSTPIPSPHAGDQVGECPAELAAATHCLVLVTGQISLAQFADNILIRLSEALRPAFTAPAASAIGACIVEVTQAVAAAACTFHHRALSALRSAVLPTTTRRSIQFALENELACRTLAAYLSAAHQLPDTPENAPLRLGFADLMTKFSPEFSLLMQNRTEIFYEGGSGAHLAELLSRMIMTANQAKVNDCAFGVLSTVREMNTRVVAGGKKLEPILTMLLG